MNTLPSTRRLDYHYIAMQAGFWAMFAAICAYQASLLQERGFSNAQVGLLIAVRCLAGIFFQPMLGGFADRHPNIPLKHIVTISLGISLLASVAFTLKPMGMAGTLLIFIIIGGLELSAYPLMDAMAIQFINAGVPIRYSLGRGIGSFAYAACCVFLGLQVGRWGVESVLVTHSVLVAAEMVLVGTYPPFYAQPLTDGAVAPQAHSTFYLLRSNPRFTLMLLGVLCGITGVLPMANFLINVVLDRGGTNAGLGIVLFIMAGFELPTAFLFQRLLRRYGSARLLLISILFCGLKAVGLLLAPSFFWVCLMQPLQMLGYGLFTPASVYYVNETVPEGDRVRGQTLMMVASNGLGGVLGSLLAGQVLDLAGVDWMLVFCAALCALGCLLAGLSLRPGKTASKTDSDV